MGVAEERTKAVPQRKPPQPALRGRLHEAMEIASQRGLLRGVRTQVVRGRMPEALVEQAKLKTGVQSDTELIELALANLAVADEYPEWLLAQRNTVAREIDLEF